MQLWGPDGPQRRRFLFFSVFLNSFLTPSISAISIKALIKECGGLRILDPRLLSLMFVRKTMRLWLGGHWLRVTALATLAWAMNAFVGASPARASCGDYLQVGHSMPAMDSAKMANQSTHQSLPGKPSAPCHGPNCSNRSSQPVSVPGISVSVRVGEWACVTTTQILTRRDPNSSIQESDSVYSNPITSTIFHPPRS